MTKIETFAFLFIAALASSSCGGSTSTSAADGGTSGGTGGATGSTSASTGAEAGSPDTGTALDASTDTQACSTASVDFRLKVAANSTTRFCGAPPGSCAGIDWLTVRDPAGLSHGFVVGCASSCAECMPLSCPLICAIPTPIGAMGIDEMWDGNFVVHGTCGNNVTCVGWACAAPGNYVATMCGYADLDRNASGLGACLNTSSTPTCVDVPFVWPPPAGTAVVEGTIDDQDN